MEWSLKRMDKGQIRKAAMAILERRGIECWIQNNLPVPGRKFIGRRGIADISGYVKKNGIRVECEVKADDDFLSAEQAAFLFDLQNSGGHALVAFQNASGYVEVLPFTLLQT